MGEFDLAIQDFDQAIRLDPEFTLAYYSRGRAYYFKDNIDHAIQDFDQVIRLDPGYVDVYKDRGWIYHEKGNDDHAIQDFGQAIRHDPGNAYAYDSLVWLRATGPRHLRDGEEAVRLAEKALALEDRPLYRNTLAEAYVEAGNVAAAIREYEAVMRMVPKIISFYRDDLWARGYYDGPYSGGYDPDMKRALTACVEAGCQPLIE